jgi:A/G-specific adenine glycosylase
MNIQEDHPLDGGLTPERIRTVREALIRWYGEAHRPLPWRETDDPYRIWVSEVMLQQTQVKTVLPYYERFIRRFPDVSALGAADLREVLKAWEGLGYYARARNLHRAAGIVSARYGGDVPREADQFRSLPGVGPYIGSAVLSIAFGEPLAVVDGNIKRVLARLCRVDAPVNDAGAKRRFDGLADRLLDRDRPGTFNQAVMELGALVCRPRTPLCPDCPLRGCCEAAAAGETHRFPVRVPRRKTPLHHLVAGVVFKGDRVLITQRPPEGLLGGLWEFPGGAMKTGESAETACRRRVREQTGLDVEVERRLARVRHAYTHFRIEMDVFVCRYTSGRVRRNGPTAHRWIRPTALDRYPLPKAHLKFIDRLRP